MGTYNTDAGPIMDWMIDRDQTLSPRKLSRKVLSFSIVLMLTNALKVVSRLCKVLEDGCDRGADILRGELARLKASDISVFDEYCRRPEKFYGGSTYVGLIFVDLARPGRSDHSEGT